MGYPLRFIDKVFLFFWDILWHISVPILLLYLWKRGRVEPLYSQDISQRFGQGDRVPAGAIWIHAVSLGELRAARPLIDALLAKKERILLTNMTAAGRSEALKIFGMEIEKQQLYIRWCPADLSWATRCFFQRHKPKFGMIMEIELWPRLIASAIKADIPLVMAQAQYPYKSFLRDQGIFSFRAQLVRGFSLILAKSERHADRFRQFGAVSVKVTGELKFEQLIPKKQIDAGLIIRKKFDPNRPIFCLVSTGRNEDSMLIPILTQLRDKADIAGKPRPFFIYVPRHPKDFNATELELKSNGLSMLKRSDAFDAALRIKADIPNNLDGVFGDSLGEINFYFTLSDAVFVGDSFNGEGSHNIIEPLILDKPVVVGPSIWGIEYPALEAIEAGVLTKVSTPFELMEHWDSFNTESQQSDIKYFILKHGGATKRIIKQLTNAGFLN